MAEKYTDDIFNFATAFLEILKKKSLKYVDVHLTDGEPALVPKGRHQAIISSWPMLTKFKHIYMPHIWPILL